MLPHQSRYIFDEIKDEIFAIEIMLLTSWAYTLGPEEKGHDWNEWVKAVEQHNSGLGTY